MSRLVRPRSGKMTLLGWVTVTSRSSITSSSGASLAMTARYVERIESIAVTYLSDAGEISAEFHGRDDVDHLTYATNGTHVRFVAPGSATRGQFGLFEWNMQPHTGGPDAHFHKTFSESFFVMKGTVEFYNGDRWTLAR